MKVVGRTKINTANIADDRLLQAAKEFTRFRVKLKELRNALRAHHANLIRTNKSQTRVLQAIIQTSPNGSPFLLDGETLLETVYDDCSRHASSRLHEYQVKLVTYVTNWESTVTTRIMAELKHVDKLFKTYVRYHKKLESLQQAANKKTKVKDAERIARNEGKLQSARKEYRRKVISVTLLTEEVTERGWKDLLPFLIRMIKFDMDSSATIADCMAQLVIVRQDLECLAERFDMNQDVIRHGRLEALLEADATAFIRKQDMQDTDSISSPSIVSSIPLVEQRSRTNPRRANPQSESSGSSDNDDSAVHESTQTTTTCTPPEYDLEEEESIITSLSSIYFNGNVLPMDDDNDDETILTPEPDFDTMSF